MRDLVAGELSEDFDVADVDAGELSFTPPDVEEARAWQIAIRVEGAAGGESEGASATAYIDLIFLREGDTIANVQTLDVLTEFDSELRSDLVDALAGRMTQ